MAKLINNRAALVITDKIQFDRSDDETEHIWKPRGKSVTGKIYANAKKTSNFTLTLFLVSLLLTNMTSRKTRAKQPVLSFRLRM